MSEGLDTMRIKSEVIEVGDLDTKACWNMSGSQEKDSLTSSRDLTSSWCLLAICFSTKDVALKSFWQVLHRNFPSSSCLMNGSTALVNSLSDHERRVPHLSNEYILIVALTAIVAGINSITIYQQSNLRI